MRKLLKYDKHGSMGKCEGGSCPGFYCNKKNTRLTYIEIYGILCCSDCVKRINNIPVEDL